MEFLARQCGAFRKIQQRVSAKVVELRRPVDTRIACCRRRRFLPSAADARRQSTAQAAPTRLAHLKAEFPKKPLTAKWRPRHFAIFLTLGAGVTTAARRAGDLFPKANPRDRTLLF